MKNPPTRTTSTELHLRVVRSIARLHGRDPAAFDAGSMADGSVCVRGPSAAAFYPAEAWVSRFTRHLVRGFFDLGARASGAGAGIVSQVVALA